MKFYYYRNYGFWPFLAEITDFASFSRKTTDFDINFTFSAEI